MNSLSGYRPEDRDSRLEAMLAVGLALIWNCVVYLGGRWIASSWHHYDMTIPADGLVPFLPWTAAVYIGAYLFWAVNYMLCARQDRAARNRFFCADALSRCVCLLFYLLIPTTNIRPEIVPVSFWDHFMALIYRVDSADNLFPSIHCLVSWFCWVGVRQRKDIPRGYRWFSLAAAVAICLSTLTTRQHVLVDVVGGILLAEGSYLIARIPRLQDRYSAAFGRLFILAKKCAAAFRRCSKANENH